MNLISQIESILFVASKPLKIRQIAKAVQKKELEVKETLIALQTKYNIESSGVHILSEHDTYQMGTNAVNSDLVDMFIKDEVSGELTKAQLETLTVVAYRCPITRPELEQIRGVNCSVILRNLIMRGLVEEGESEDKILPVYNFTVEALRHLGIKSVAELPDYDQLNAHEFIEAILEKE
jgi:segregation and condensation protein B